MDKVVCYKTSYVVNPSTSHNPQDEPVQRLFFSETWDWVTLWNQKIRVAFLVHVNPPYSSENYWRGAVLVPRSSVVQFIHPFPTDRLYIPFSLCFLISCSPSPSSYCAIYFAPFFLLLRKDHVCSDLLLLLEGCRVICIHGGTSELKVDIRSFFGN